MKLARCPTCHSNIHLEALIQDDAGKEMAITQTKLDRGPAYALVTYIGLFRAAKSNLANDRAWRLMEEVKAIGGGTIDVRLELAMAETVQAIRAKQGVPLRNHAYLKRVYESMPHPGVVRERGAVAGVPARAAPKSATLEALEALEAYKRG